MYVLRLFHELWAQRAVRWAIAFVAGVVWWWALLRLVAQPAQAGSFEGLVVAGGWGLSIVPLHTARWSRGSSSAARAAVREVEGPVPGGLPGRVPGPRSTSRLGHDDAPVRARGAAGRQG
ncbi:hypothetical protein [Actinacidiphila sp. bgisy167]|uniref:hypothetical protein n=1 Tax=Actinacidiphila sp. bgisy167 TaxID=3413797 RepID=UPI003D739982